ncbi:MAG: hypothetical protein JNK72_13195 [Myxococcales bacterium]|nr:hypothetical protein [Myxococcales bacterium]
MTLRILVSAEDVLSATLARALCDRVVYEAAAADWLRALWAPELRDTQRVWMGLSPDSDWADRRLVEHLAAARGLPGGVRARETGRRRAPHGAARQAFRAMQLAAVLDPRPDVVLLAADTDGETPEGERFEVGVAMADVALPAVAASFHRESEAWVVSGFVPENAAERARLREVTDRLGFDPTLASERLMSDRMGDPRDAKWVARTLLGAGAGLAPLRARAQKCWAETPLDVLRARGRRNGLAAYCDALERVLLPRFGDTPRAALSPG